MNRAGIAARRAAAAARITPRHWDEALDQASRLARAAVELSGQVTASAGDLSQFRLRMNELVAESFPLASEHARAAAAAFLFAGRAFAHAAIDPETRTACAPVLREAARYAEQLMSRHRTAKADLWRGQYGGDA